ncbi:MAG: hypothetical protein PF495_04290, partial [Spirochaetales bacterium]|nr:hypothetical protein [Spirochaetales bacterium]
MNIGLRKSLKNKMILSFLLLSFIPALSIGIYTQIYSRGEQRSMLHAEMEAINLTKEQQIIRYLQEQIQ